MLNFHLLTDNYRDLFLKIGSFYKSTPDSYISEKNNKYGLRYIEEYNNNGDFFRSWALEDRDKSHYGEGYKTYSFDYIMKYWRDLSKEEIFILKAYLSGLLPSRNLEIAENKPYQFKKYKKYDHLLATLYSKNKSNKKGSVTYVSATGYISNLMKYWIYKDAQQSPVLVIRHGKKSIFPKNTNIKEVVFDRMNLDDFVYTIRKYLPRYMKHIGAKSVYFMGFDYLTPYAISYGISNSLHKVAKEHKYKIFWAGKVKDGRINKPKIDDLLGNKLFKQEFDNILIYPSKSYYVYLNLKNKFIELRDTIKKLKSKLKENKKVIDLRQIIDKNDFDKSYNFNIVASNSIPFLEIYNTWTIRVDPPKNKSYCNFEYYYTYEIYEKTEEGIDKAAMGIRHSTLLNLQSFIPVTKFKKENPMLECKIKQIVTFNGEDLFRKVADYSFMGLQETYYRAKRLKPDTQKIYDKLVGLRSIAMNLKIKETELPKLERLINNRYSILINNLLKNKQMDKVKEENKLYKEIITKVRDKKLKKEGKYFIYEQTQSSKYFINPQFFNQESIDLIKNNPLADFVSDRFVQESEEYRKLDNIAKDKGLTGLERYMFARTLAMLSLPKYQEFKEYFDFEDLAMRVVNTLTEEDLKYSMYEVASTIPQRLKDITVDIYQENEKDIEKLKDKANNLMKDLM